MNTTRYYFSNVIEEDLVALADMAKDVLRNTNNLVSIYQNNDDILYGQSPSQVLYLMKQNNKSIFSSSPNSKSSSSVTKSNPEQSTPVTNNPDVQRRFLPCDAAEIKVSHIGTLGTSTPVKQQTVKDCGKNKDATVDETADEHFVSPVGSTGNPCPNNQGSPGSAEVIMISSGLAMDEEVLVSPTKVIGSLKSDNPDSPQSSEAIVTTLSMNEQNCSSNLVARADAGLTVSGKVLSRPAEILSSDLTESDKESKSLVQDQSLLSLSIDTDALAPEKKDEISNYPSSVNKDYFNLVEETVEISEPTDTEIETPSPIKRFKMCSISATDIQELKSSVETINTANSSLEDGRVSISPIKDDKMNINPNEATTGIVSDKRKSPSPKKNKTLFRSIPRVLEVVGDAKIDIEISCDTTSPITSRNSSIDYKSNKTVMKNLIKDDIKGVSGDESITEAPPSSIETYLSPLKKAISVSPSVNVPGTNNPGSDDNIFYLGHCSSDAPSTSAVAPKEQLSESLSSSTDVKTDLSSLKYMLMKFDVLLFHRKQVMESIFKSMLLFQNNLHFLNNYMNHVGYVVQQIGLPEKEYATTELKEIENDVLAIATRLSQKLTSWIVSLDQEMNTWYKCFEQIEQVKLQYGPLFTKEGKPQMTIEVLQIYESDMRTIWKILDDMILMEDSRRSLFSQTAHDFEMMTKLFVKCLIHVGILKSR